MPKRVPRKIRPTEKNVPKGYDSKWEHTLHTTILQEWEHHTNKVPYIVEHKYEPDFVKIIGDKEYLLEAWYSEDTLPDSWRNDGL